MDIAPPPPSLITIPQVYNNYNNDDVVKQRHSSSSPTSSLVIVVIIISSAIIVTATIYLLIRFISRRFNNTVENDVVSNNRNNEQHVRRHHVISLPNDNDYNVNESHVSLPLFTFSSLTGKIAGGDCAVCLSKFESVDQLRLLPLCCHAFHAQCIDAWLKSNQTCPLCRSNVNPTEDDVINKIASISNGGDRSNSFRIHIGSISRRRDPSESDRRSYSIGSYEYILDDDGYEISVESTHRRHISDCTSVDKDSTVTTAENEVAGGGSGRRNWLRDYVDRVSVSLSSRTTSFRGSGRFFTGSSRRNETVTVEDYEAGHGRIGEEISELFRWFSGV